MVGKLISLDPATANASWISEKMYIMYFFYFACTGLQPVYVCKTYYNKGRYGNPCLVKCCQASFEIDDGMYVYNYCAFVTHLSKIATIWTSRLQIFTDQL